MAKEINEEVNIGRVEQEKVTTITRMFAYGTEYGTTKYESRESMQLTEDTPRKAIQAEEIFLGLRVKYAVLREAKDDGVLSDEDYMQFMKGSYSQFIRGVKLLTEVKDLYMDTKPALSSVEHIKDELVALGLMKVRSKKA